MEVDSQPGTRDAPERVALQMAPSNVNDEIQIIETFVREENWPARIREAWERVKQATGDQAQQPQGDVPGRAIADINAQLKDLTTAVRKLVQQPAQRGPQLSYAAVLQGVGKPMPPQAQGEMPVPARRSRELVIAPGTETTAQKQRSGREIVRDVNEKIQCEAVVAARRLPSGDTLLTFEGEEAKRKWQGNIKVTEAFGADAKLRIREYTVIAHGVRVASLDVKDQKAGIASIYTQNPALKGVVTVVRIGWSHKTIKQGKRTAPLFLGIAEPEQANLLIEQGLLLGAEFHDCEIFCGDCQVTQCFRCQSYGHTAKHCQNVVRCGHCAAAGHKSTDCTKKEDHTAHRCVVCKGKHPAWSRDCSVRKAQAAAARQAYLSRPSRFQIRIKHRETPITQTPIIDLRFNTSQETTAFVGSTVESDIEVEAPPPPKRRRGRPFAYESLPKAAAGSQDIRHILTNNQNE